MRPNALNDSKEDRTLIVKRMEMTFSDKDC